MARVPASAADRVFLDCRGADIPLRRACRTAFVALTVRPIVGYGAGVSGSPGQDALMLQEFEDGSWMAGLPTGCLETGVIWADGRVPARESSSRPGFGRWSGPGTSRRRPPVRSRSPGRSKVRLPSMSAPCTAVTLSDTGRHWNAHTAAVPCDRRELRDHQVGHAEQVDMRLRPAQAGDQTPWCRHRPGRDPGRCPQPRRPGPRDLLRTSWRPTALPAVTNAPSGRG